MSRGEDKEYGMSTTEVAVFGADFDFPSGTVSMDVLERFKRLAKFLPAAETLNMCIVGRLETKDAFRIRLKGIYQK